MAGKRLSGNNLLSQVISVAIQCDLTFIAIHFTFQINPNQTGGGAFGARANFEDL